MTGEVRVRDFDFRLKWSLKQGVCTLQSFNFIRYLELFICRGRTSGHAVQTPLKGVILGVIYFFGFWDSLDSRIQARGYMST